jgi:lipopolysaccharide/colanic/teichoic acid biosynthesis glycosyltransferase
MQTLSAGDVTLSGTYWYDLRARNPFGAGLKRLMDLAIAVPLVTLAAPVLLFRGITSEVRVGFRGHEFEAFVFRAPVRGRSRSSLPQLLNVLEGTMTLVGPRAMLPYEVEHHDARRFSVKPGVTGLWRVAEGPERDLDRQYVNAWSLRQDLVILLKAALRLVVPRR